MVQRRRPAALRAASLAILVAIGAQSAFAQALPRVHVLSLTLRSDVRSPQVGRPFHLIISGRLREQLGSVDFVVLPNLAELEPLGDERHAIATARGTAFSETLTVVARRAGQVHIGSAYLDAVDPRDQKPKRYYSNDLTLTVGGAAPLQNGAGSLAAFLARLVAGLFLVFAAGWIFLKRRAPVRAVADIPAIETPLPPPSPSADELSSAFADLKRNRDRDAVMRLRFALWKNAGATGGETLGDLLARNGARGSLQSALRTTERAAFIEDAQLSAAVEHAIAALERHLA